MSEEPSIDYKVETNVNPVTVKTENPLNHEALDETENYEIVDQQSDRGDNGCYSDMEPEDNENDPVESDGRPKFNKTLILGLIEEYKQHRCLWENYMYKTTNRLNRDESIKAITKAINYKFTRNFTDTEVRNKLRQLRSGYRRVLRNKEAFEKKHANARRKFFPQLWYFDKMTFIGEKESDFSVSRRRKGKTKAQEDDFEEEDEDNESTASEESDKEEKNKKAEKGPPKMKLLTRNRELLTAIIEEYKKFPCLWAVSYYSNDNLTRRNAYTTLAKVINEKFNTQFTYKTISKELAKVRLSYKQYLQRKAETAGKFKSRIWYADLLSFVELNKDFTKEPGERPHFSEDDDFDSANEPTSAENDGSEDEGRCDYRRKGKIKSREHVFAIIDLYKEAPVLWDTNHEQHTLRTIRKKAIEKIIGILSAKHDCHLTVEEFRYHIRFLRDSYFRIMRQLIATKNGEYSPKPFFYDRMSFLEPFADKKILTAPVAQSFPVETDSSEQFKFLTENRALMTEFIEMYKAHGCLWDQTHTDKDNAAAHSEAYDKIMNLFLQNDIIFTKDQVLSAINFLHATVVKAQKKFEFYDTNNKNEPPIWFYEQLQFLGRISRFKSKYCSHCDQHFRTLAEYEKHKIEIAGDYPYKCAVCNAGFVSRSKYAYHQITHKQPHKCEQCGFQAYDRHNFNVHMRRHKGIHPYKCQHCEKGFVTSTELNRHMRMHTGERPFICHICGKALAANSEFHQHMKRHRNQRDHKCELCGSAFFTPKTLRDHMASHSKERQHVCEVCGAAFKRQKTLHQHKALHMENKKHECKICGKMFAQAAGLYSHMKSHGH